MLKRNKYVLALRCLTIGLTIDSTHPQLNYQLIQFARQFYSQIGISSLPISPESSEKKTLLPVIEDVIREKLSILLSGEGEEALNRYLENYVQNIENNSEKMTVLHRLIAAKLVVSFGSLPITDREQRAVSLLIDDQLWNGRGVNYQNTLKVLQVLESDFSSVEGAANTFREKMQLRYPSSNLFNLTGMPIHKGVLDLEISE